MLVWLCLSVCLTTVFSACFIPLGLKEGDVCKLAAGAPWTCKNIKECPKAAKGLEDGDNKTEVCGLTPELELTVCCEPEVGRGAKSIEMCKKYAESVFIRIPDELGDGGIRTYDTCGRFKPNPSRHKRVIGGIESQSREFPHMALIGFGNKTAPEWNCGGTLISERFILTGGNCAVGGPSVGPPKIVRLGDLNIQSETDEDDSVSQPSEYEIVEIIKHPDFKPPVKYNDIALLKLDKDVFFTEFIRPICLQTEHRLPTTHGSATGWGYTEFHGQASHTLLTVNVTFFSQDDCFKMYDGVNNRRFKDGISEMTMICAGDKEGNRDTCQGDSGGPLQIALQEPYCMYSQVGITSFGRGCGSSIPGVYTRISHYVPWIESIVWPSPSNQQDVYWPER